MPSCIPTTSHNHFSYFINLPISHAFFPYTGTHSAIVPLISAVFGICGFFSPLPLPPISHSSQYFSQALASSYLLTDISAFLPGPDPNSLLGKKPLQKALPETFLTPQNTVTSPSQQHVLSFLWKCSQIRVFLMGGFNFFSNHSLLE